MDAALREIIVRQSIPPPASLQLFLMERDFKDLALKATDMEGIKRLVAAIKPWSTGPACAGATFNIFSPTLAPSDLPPVDKAKMFVSRISSAVLIPLVLRPGGEAGVRFIHEACDFLLGVLDEVNHGDVDDSILQCALELAEVIAPLRAIMVMDLEMHVAQLPALQYMMRQSTKVGTSLLCVIGLAMRRASWPIIRLEAILKQEASLTGAAKEIREHKAALENTSGDGGIAQRIPVVVAACKSLTKFQATLSKEYYSGFERDVEGSVNDVIRKVVEGFDAQTLNMDDVPGMAAELQEFSIAFPQNRHIIDLQDMVATKLSDGRKASLQDDLSNQCKAFAAIDIDKAGISAKKTALSGIIEATRKAEGVVMTAEHGIEQVVQAAKECDKIAFSTEVGVDDAKHFLDAIVAVSPFVAQVPDINMNDMANCLKAFLALRRATDEYKNMLQGNIDERIQTGSFKMDLLAGLMSSAKMLREMRGKCGHLEVAKKVVATADDLVQNASEKLLKNAMDEVRAAKKDLDTEMGLGRTENGEVWSSPLGPSPTWKAYSQLAQETVSKMEPKKVHGAHQRLAAAVTTHTELAKQFGAREDNDEVRAAALAVCEARACLVVGASVALLLNPSADRLKQHRSLQTQLKSAASPELTPFVCGLLVEKLKVATGFKSKS